MTNRRIDTQEIHFRSDDARRSPGVIEAVLLTYGERARSIPEVIAQDALSWPETGIPLNRNHSADDFMRVVPYVDGAQLKVRAELPDTSVGRDVAAVMRADPPLYGGMSIEYVADGEEWNGDVWEVTAGRLVGAALVSRTPAYAGTSVAVRDDRAGRLPPWWW